MDIHKAREHLERGIGTTGNTLFSFRLAARVVLDSEAACRAELEAVRKHRDDLARQKVDHLRKDYIRHGFLVPPGEVERIPVKPRRSRWQRFKRWWMCEEEAEQGRQIIDDLFFKDRE